MPRHERLPRNTSLARLKKLLSLIVSLSAISEAFQVRHGGVRRAPQKKASPVEMSLRSEMKKMSGTFSGKILRSGCDSSRSTGGRNRSKDPSVSWTSTSPPKDYDPQRAGELLLESMGTYDEGGRADDINYRCAKDFQSKTQVVVRHDHSLREATVVFRGTANLDDLRSDFQLLTISTDCFKRNGPAEVKDGKPTFRNKRWVGSEIGSYMKPDMYGTMHGTGFLEALSFLVRRPGPRVHRGFARRALKYSCWVQDQLRERSPPVDLKDPDWRKGGIGNLSTLYITGHSLGGATALAFAYWVKVAFKETNPDLVVHVYVFSAPNVGNAAWAKDYNEMLGNTTFQHNYGPDLVPLFFWWLEKVGHVLSIKHKVMKGWTGKATSEDDYFPMDMSVEDKSANILDYHLGLARVLMPYFEHLKPESALKAWKKYVDLQTSDFRPFEMNYKDPPSTFKDIFPKWVKHLIQIISRELPIEVTLSTTSTEDPLLSKSFQVDSFEATDVAQRMKPAELYMKERYYEEKVKRENEQYVKPIPLRPYWAARSKRRPHFRAEEDKIDFTWSFPSDKNWIETNSEKTVSEVETNAEKKEL